MRHLFFCLVLSFGVMGCHSVPVNSVKPADFWRAHQQTLIAVTHWDISGKFSFHQEKTTLGSFEWQQEGEVFRLHFVGPFSVGSARLEGDAQQVLFMQKDKQPLRGGSPEDLLVRHMGWCMPLTPLRYWIKGQLYPGEPAKILWDEKQHLVSIKQMGWEVILSDYQIQQGVALPSRLTLRHDDVWAKLVVKSWHWSS